MYLSQWQCEGQCVVEGVVQEGGGEGGQGEGEEGEDEVECVNNHQQQE